MTEQSEEPPSFSFRTFDLYRRFVEILQKNPDILENFKTNAIPNEEICRSVIKKVFVHRQAEDQIIIAIRYLQKNCKLIVLHAENKPEVWNQAIKYTDNCIKQIKKYLKEKGLSSKSHFDVLNNLVEEIGIYLHRNPSKIQLEAIREYLKFDINNPRKSLTDKSKRIKHKSKKSEKVPEKTETINNPQPIETSLTLNDQNVNGESFHVENEVVVISKSLNEAKDETSEKLSNTDLVENQTELYSDSTKHFFEQNNLLHIEDTDSKFNDIIIQDDKIYDVEYIKSFLSRTIVLKEIETDIQEGVENEENNLNSSGSKKYYLQLKRKNSDCSEEYNDNCIKRLFVLDDSLNIQDEESQDKKYYYERDQTQTSDSIKTVYVQLDNDDSNNVLSIIDDIVSPEWNNNSNDIKYKNNIIKLNTQDLLYTSENKEESEKYNSIIDRNTSKIKNMTYVEALKIMDIIVAFCKFKGEIYLEEYLVLRRTKDKIKWESLKETNLLFSRKIKENEEYNNSNDNNYSYLKTMSYGEALEKIETIITFCEIKNEVSLEEYIILCRIRSKIKCQSLKEIKKN